jgi:hypothetical protein
MIEIGSTPEPGYDHGCFSVDLTHPLYLVPSLNLVALVDA